MWLARWRIYQDFYGIKYNKETEKIWEFVCLFLKIKIAWLYYFWKEVELLKLQSNFKYWKHLRNAGLIRENRPSFQSLEGLEFHIKMPFCSLHFSIFWPAKIDEMTHVFKISGKKFVRQANSFSELNEVLKGRSARWNHSIQKSKSLSTFN